jgi:hypothetical protein
MQDIIVSAIRLWEARLPNGNLMISSYKGSNHYYLTYLKVLNINLRKAGYDRMRVLSNMLERPVTSTYDMTVGEVQAISTLIQYGDLDLEAYNV